MVILFSQILECLIATCTDLVVNKHLINEQINPSRVVQDTVKGSASTQLSTGRAILPHIHLKSRYSIDKEEQKYIRNLGKETWKQWLTRAYNYFHRLGHYRLSTELHRIGIRHSAKRTILS